MKALHVSTSRFTLPVEFLTSTQVILAKKGKGKSYLAGVQAEELLELGQQVVIIDPTGAWWGLRSSADGKKAGYPIAVLGGEHADVPLETTAGEVIADAIANEHFSAVIDLTLFRKGEALRFMAAFMETLYRKNREALHLFIDEADVVAPQKTYGPEQARVLGATEDIVRRGRIRGIGCTLITQRPQVLNKDVLTQADMLTTLGMNHPRDLGAIADWVAVHGDPKQATKMNESLPALPLGQAWFWAPSWKIFDRVTIRAKRTFDSGKTPKPGEHVVAPKVLADVDLKRLGAQIASTVERVKANDPRALHARIQELERELAKKGAGKTIEVEKSVVREPDLKRLEKVLARSVLLEEKLHTQLEQLVAESKAMTAVLGKAPASVPLLRDPFPRGGLASAFSRKPAPAPAPARTNGHAHPTPATTDGINASQQRILDTLATLAQLGIEPTRETLAAWCSSHPNSKGYTNNLGALRSAGLLEGYQLTSSGAAAARTLDVTSTSLRERILGPLNSSQRKLVDIVLSSPRISREQLAEAYGSHPNSKGFTNNIGALRTRGLLTDHWPIEPTRVLDRVGLPS